MIIMMVAIFAIMWFFMIRPQQKRQKEIQKFQNELTEGQQVVTGGGIYGTVKSIDLTKNTVDVKIARDVVITVDKNYVFKDVTSTPMQKGFRKMWQTFRDFVFSNTNRDFLVFLFFLSLSFIFWLSLTLNDTYEREFSIPVSVVDIPKNAVLTSDEVDTVKMTIRDKGIILVAYQYGDYLNRLRIPFKNYTRNNGTGHIPASELQKLVYQQLVSSSKIVSTKPDKIEFFYNYGTHKKVPVRWSLR